ncbi:MAG: 50S ribosomal protein L29 [Planctomycetes bacterium]|nr:50S ribosomal protein L29 [Planctomycetota bacterium]
MARKTTAKAAKGKAQTRGALALRAKAEAELAQDLHALREEHYNLRFQRASGNLQNTSRRRVVRRSIARILTVQGERARMAAPAAGKGTA